MHTDTHLDTPAAVVGQRFSVIGMTCSHCEHAIAAEVTELDGVVAVVADAVSGTVIVEGTRVLSPNEVGAAVDRAGYELAR
jgi:copper chaperone CopZ